MERQQLPEQPGLFAGVQRASAFSATTARQTTERNPARRLDRQYLPASPHRAGYHAGTHPEDAPYTSTEFQQRPRQTVNYEEEVEEYDDAPQRQHTSARRYTTPSGRTTRVVNEPLLTRRLPSRRLSGRLLLCSGVLLVIMIAGWFSLSALVSWWQIHQDDTMYGRPRTAQYDVVVGHNQDSQQSPSHVVALNLHRHCLVVEFPAGDPSRAIIYTCGTLLGKGEDLLPITLSFEDRNGDGRPDLNIHIGDQVVVFLNNGQKFVSSPQH